MARQLDADSVAALSCVLCTICSLYYYTGSISEVLLFSTSSVVCPILSLPFVRQQRPFVASGVNLVSYFVGQQMRQAFPRAFGMAVSLFSAIRSYDLAIHHHTCSWGRQYAGMVLLSDSTNFRKVDTYRQLYSLQDAREILTACILIPTFADLFAIITKQKSNDYYMTTTPSSFNDWIIMFLRSFFVAMLIEEVLGSLTFLRRLFYAPFKTIHPSVMNHPFRAATLAEFWSFRWNLTMHGFFKRNVHVPVLKKTGSKPVADLAAFFASGLFHVVMLAGSGVFHTLSANILCMLFFLSQAVLFVVERRLFRGQARGSTMNRFFTYTALFLTAPLVIEPGLRHYNM
jgi:hypothetical protein